jgi:non-heme chloroperoxidase
MSRRSAMALGVGGALAAATATMVAQAAPAGAQPDSGKDHQHLATRIRVADGVEVFVQDIDGGNRGTVMFVPGWPLPSGTFEKQYLFLADRGFRAIGLDLRGFGRSDAPYGPYGYDVWASDIREVQKALRLQNVTVVGHSMGGAVALRHTARFGNRVGKLVLVEASAPKYVFGPNAPQLAAGLAGLINGYATDRTATVRALAQSFFMTHTDVDHDPYLQYFERQCVNEASLQASRAGLVGLRDEDLTSDLRRVKVPTRVFHAVQDPIVPFDHGQALAKGIPGARLIPFAKGGHGVYIDEPDKFNHELLKFVN